jgi:hypothetical protein
MFDHAWYVTAPHHTRLGRLRVRRQGPFWVGWAPHDADLLRSFCGLVRFPGEDLAAVRAAVGRFGWALEEVAGGGVTAPAPRVRRLDQASGH